MRTVARLVQMVRQEEHHKRQENAERHCIQQLKREKECIKLNRKKLEIK
ncbi:hypothetical protein ATL10_10597 [Bacillus sp. 196mf]|nr:hypothetical protein ATL10_10597 [Bacillus sp. 196mf]